MEMVLGDPRERDYGPQVENLCSNLLLGILFLLASK